MGKPTRIVMALQQAAIDQVLARYNLTTKQKEIIGVIEQIIGETMNKQMGAIEKMGIDEAFELVGIAAECAVACHGVIKNMSDDLGDKFLKDKK